MQPNTSLPTVASLWMGDALNWLHALSLASFVHRGHEVVLFCVGPAPQVPEGVRTAPIEEIWDPAPAGHADAPASMLSDLFRLYLLKQTDMMWVDTDMLCFRPFPDVDYHVGFEPPGTINGAVLRLPKTSQTLNQMIDWFEDPEFIGPWMNRKHTAILKDTPPGQRLLKSFELRRPSIGPRALDYTLKQTGEVQHVRSADVYYPIRGILTDVFFCNGCEEDGWITDDTLGIHLYHSMIRRYHRNYMPIESSFIARFAREIGFDMSGLKQEERG